MLHKEVHCAEGVSVPSMRPYGKLDKLEKVKRYGGCIFEKRREVHPEAEYAPRELILPELHTAPIMEIPVGGWNH